MSEAGAAGPGCVGPRLIWNVKSSFRSYVEQAGGAVTVTAPAALAPDASAFVFAFDAARSESEPGIHRFRGSVRFRAHGGALDLLVEDPWLHVGSEGVQLSIRGTEATRSAGGRLLLASVESRGDERADGSRVWREAPTLLLAEGTVAFDFRYPVGTELAALTCVAPVEEFSR